MINAAAIVEQTAEIFASRARPMVPFSDKYEARYFVELTSGEAEVFGGILYRANPFLPPVRHDQTLCL